MPEIQRYMPTKPLPTLKEDRGHLAIQEAQAGAARAMGDTLSGVADFIGNRAVFLAKEAIRNETSVYQRDWEAALYKFQKDEEAMAFEDDGQGRKMYETMPKRYEELAEAFTARAGSKENGGLVYKASQQAMSDWIKQASLSARAKVADLQETMQINLGKTELKKTIEDYVEMENMDGVVEAVKSATLAREEDKTTGTTYRPPMISDAEATEILKSADEIISTNYLTRDIDKAGKANTQSLKGQLDWIDRQTLRTNHKGERVPFTDRQKAQAKATVTQNWNIMEADRRSNRLSDWHNLYNEWAALWRKGELTLDIINAPNKRADFTKYDPQDIRKMFTQLAADKASGSSSASSDEDSPENVFFWAEINDRLMDLTLPKEEVLEYAASYNESAVPGSGIQPVSAETVLKAMEKINKKTDDDLVNSTRKILKDTYEGKAKKFNDKGDYEGAAEALKTYRKHQETLWNYLNDEHFRAQPLQKRQEILTKVIENIQDEENIREMEKLFSGRSAYSTYTAEDPALVMQEKIQNGEVYGTEPQVQTELTKLGTYWKSKASTDLGKTSDVVYDKRGRALNPDGIVKLFGGQQALAYKIDSERQLYATALEDGGDPVVLLTYKVEGKSRKPYLAVYDASVNDFVRVDDKMLDEIKTVIKAPRGPSKEDVERAQEAAKGVMETQREKKAKEAAALRLYNTLDTTLGGIY